MISRQRRRALRALKAAARAACLGVACATIAAGAAGAAEVDRELLAARDRLAPGERLPVIAYMDARLDPSAIRGLDRAAMRRRLVRALERHARRSQAPVRRWLAMRGITAPRELWIVNALAFEADGPLIDAIAASPFPLGLRIDRRLRQETPQSSSGVDAPAEWNIDRIRAPELWARGIDGTGIVVAAMDSGVDAAHQDLAGRYRGGANSWYDPNGEHATPYDATGHGTQVMGLIVGGDAGGTSIGVAPGALWIAVKIFDDAGDAPTSSIHAGFQWLLDPDGDASTDDAPDVVNNSWGLIDRVGECVLEFQPDLQALRAAGIAVVFSAGNQGPLSSSSLSPANNPEGFACGSTDSTNAVDAASSRGPSACDASIYPEVVAPGVNVWTADLTLGGIFPDSYTSVTGTSFAAPHVAGAMALLLQAHPGTDPSLVESSLTETAVDLGAPGPDNDAGHGLIDAVAAEAWLADPPCTDADGDGAYAESWCGPVVDCDDGDGESWATPGEVRAVSFGADHVTISWLPPESPGGADVYDTIRSSEPADFDAGGTCVEWDDGADEQATDADLPPAGAGFFYLVRAENGCPQGSGPLGSGSDGTPRSARACP